MEHDRALGARARRRVGARRAGRRTVMAVSRLAIFDGPLTGTVSGASSVSGPRWSCPGPTGRGWTGVHREGGGEGSARRRDGTPAPGPGRRAWSTSPGADPAPPSTPAARTSPSGERRAGTPPPEQLPYQDDDLLPGAVRRA
uniref:Uncharacterized protein n=1 Tax=Streptomyces sp. FR1 TaxID=349971 RepID=V9Z3X4_9ACTN|nr:hypothetical protein pFRL3_455c [Streptomyces sp. FR1]